MHDVAPIPDEMTAWVLDAPRPVEEGPLRRATVPTPKPGPGQVLVKVSTCAVCRTDLHVVEGDLEVRKSPVIPGHQVVGTVAAVGDGVNTPPGARVGVAWLHHTCGVCPHCTRGDENLCDAPDFSGWTVDGGYAQYMLAPADFVYPIPDGFPDDQAAPLLCAGIIGFRCLHRNGLDEAGWAGARLGIYGFGAAGHVCIQLAISRGAEVYVCTRDAERHQALARELGATWVGGAKDPPPVPLDASIIFAPAGDLVPPGLEALRKGGSLVLGGIHMSPIPKLPYSLLYWERCLRSVANNTRADGHAFLAEAARIPVHTHVNRFPLDRCNQALRDLKHDAFRGAAVLVVD